mgnify:CR=1 FL=1
MRRDRAPGIRKGPQVSFFVEVMPPHGVRRLGLMRFIRCALAPARARENAFEILSSLLYRKYRLVCTYGCISTRFLWVASRVRMHPTDRGSTRLSPTARTAAANASLRRQNEPSPRSYRRCLPEREPGPHRTWCGAPYRPPSAAEFPCLDAPASGYAPLRMRWLRPPNRSLPNH